MDGDDVGDINISHRIITGATQRGKNKLVYNRGYSYTLKVDNTKHKNIGTSKEKLHLFMWIGDENIFKEMISPLLIIIPTYFRSSVISYILCFQRKRCVAVDWWCSVRNNRVRCPATVCQRGVDYTIGCMRHNHNAEPGIAQIIELTKKVINYSLIL